MVPSHLDPFPPPKKQDTKREHQHNRQVALGMTSYGYLESVRSYIKDTGHFPDNFLTPPFIPEEYKRALDYRVSAWRKNLNESFSPEKGSSSLADNTSPVDQDLVMRICAQIKKLHPAPFPPPIETTHPQIYQGIKKLEELEALLLVDELVRKAIPSLSEYPDADNILMSR